MRKLAWMALLFLIPTVAAQESPMVFNQDFQVRAAFGDIPTTAVEEPDGFWNVEELLRVQHDNRSTTEVRFTRPPNTAASSAQCIGCAPEDQARLQENQWVITLGPNTSSGAHDLVFTYAMEAGAAIGTSIPDLARFGEDAVVFLYVPESHRVTSNVEVDLELPSTPQNPGLVIHQFTGTPDRPLDGDAWFAIHPETASDGVVAAPGGFPWLQVALAMLAGMLIWAFLVQKGVVQRRARKQVAGQAAHASMAEAMSKGELEARKRTLMAALKELEVAKMNKELESNVYDVLKAEYKRETVHVMRALEGKE